MKKGSCFLVSQEVVPSLAKFQSFWYSYILAITDYPQFFNLSVHHPKGICLGNVNVGGERMPSALVP
jgi:hypothetical protein